MCSIQYFVLYSILSTYIHTDHLSGNFNFFRPFGPMTIQATEKNPLLAEDDLLPAAVACRHLAF